MPAWPPSVRHAFLALAPYAAVAGPICRAAASGNFSGVNRLHEVCTAAGLAEVRSSAVEAVLVVGASCGLFERQSMMEWCPVDIPFAELATALEGVALYRENVHVDVDVVEVVLTPPGKPSRLGEALRTRGWIESDLEHTESVLRHIAMNATTRFAVLSPFLDSAGTEHLVALFDATKPEVKRVLVTRCPGNVPVPALLSALPTLTALGVTVHNYWLPRAVGYETFHAKVFLGDDRIAYIGSANMTQASLWLSMELGTFLKGSSVKTLVSVVDAILAVAPALG